MITTTQRCTFNAMYVVRMQTNVPWCFSQVVGWLVGWLVGFVALRPKSTAMVIAGRSVHLTTPFPGQA